MSYPLWDIPVLQLGPWGRLSWQRCPCYLWANLDLRPRWSRDLSCRGLFQTPPSSQFHPVEFVSKCSAPWTRCSDCLGCCYYYYYLPPCPKCIHLTRCICEWVNKLSRTTSRPPRQSWARSRAGKTNCPGWPNLRLPRDGIYGGVSSRGKR